MARFTLVTTLHARMVEHMLANVTGSCEIFAACLTLVGLLACVDSLMLLEMNELREAFIAGSTDERALFSVHS